MKDEGTLMVVSETYKMDYHMANYKTSRELYELLEKLKFKDLMLYEDNGWMCLIGKRTS